MPTAEIQFEAPIERSLPDDSHAYFLILSASQGFINLPQHAHSFAMFARVSGDAPPGRLRPDQTFCISWLPKSLRIRLLGGPETGVNLGWEATLDWAASWNARVGALGPFRIRPELYEQARQRRNFLETGAAQFVVFDGKYRPDRATNCIHAISDLGLTPDLLRTGFAYGHRANLKLLSYFRPWIETPGQTYPWVAELIGLNCKDIAFQLAE